MIDKFSTVWLFVIISVTILFFACCFVFIGKKYWEEIRGFLYSLLDFYTLHRIKKTRIVIFKFGWGAISKYKALDKYFSPEKPHEIEINWIATKKKDTQIGIFRSPLHYILRKGEKNAQFLYETPNNEDVDTIVMHFPAAGQLAYEERWKILGKHCVKNNFAYCAPMAPIYGARRSKKQNECNDTYQQVSDSPVTFHAFLEESRSIVNYFSKKYNYIILTGMSMGSFMVGQLSKIPLLDEEDKERVKIGYVPFMSFMSSLLPDSFRRISENSLKKHTPPEELKFIFSKEGLSNYQKVNEVIKYYHDKPFKDLMEKKSNVDVIMLIHAKYDRIISKKEKRDVEDFLRGIAKRNGVEDKFFVKTFTMGHSGSFIHSKTIDKFRKQIIECHKILKTC